MRYKRSLGNLLLCWYKKNEFRWFGCQSRLAKANNYISRFSSSSFRHFTVATARSSMTVLQAPIEARPPDFIIFLGSIQQKPRKGCLAFKKPSSFYFSEVANFAAQKLLKFADQFYEWPLPRLPNNWLNYGMRGLNIPQYPKLDKLKEQEEKIS